MSVNEGCTDNRGFIVILNEIRGTGAPGVAPVDGMYYEIAVNTDYHGNAGMYGDIVSMYGEILDASDINEQTQEWMWNAQAAALTAESLAILFVDGAGGSAEYVKTYTSNGDGTFTVTPTDGVYSARWYGFNADVSAQQVQEGFRDSFTFYGVTSQTTFQVAYTPGLVDVYVEGIKLIDGVDFTATNGTSVILSVPLPSSKDVEIVVLGLYVVDGGIKEW